MRPILAFAFTTLTGAVGSVTGLYDALDVFPSFIACRALHRRPARAPGEVLGSLNSRISYTFMMLSRTAAMSRMTPVA